MTTLIQQRSGNDCVLAAIAMAAGAAAWEEVWTQADLDAVIASKGVSDVAHWLVRAGFKEGDFREVYLHGERAAAALLWRRPALLSVASLNNNGGSHMIFWDGERVFDPHEGHYPQFIAFRHLTSCSISRAFLLDELRVARSVAPA